MNVLSLFDGMSCLQIALKELSIDYGTYYASEIDKHAIAQTQLNFPDTIQLGSVTEWQSWDIDWSKIGLIGAGSPCQGFSFAGKQLAFDDERSKLFFVFVDILNHAKKFNPDIKFLFENVNMKKSHMKVINDFLGLRGVNINSNLVSAQNRNRWYWSNIRTKREGLFGDLITDIPQPKDQGILLKDILEDEVDEKYYLSEKLLKYITDKNRIDKKFTAINGEKSLSLMAGYYNSSNGTYCIDNNGRINEDKTGTILSSYHKGVEQYGSRPFILINKPNQDKASCFTAGEYSGGNHSDMDLICVAQRGRGENNTQEFEERVDNITNALTSVQKDNLIIQVNTSIESGGKQPYQQNRVYDSSGIMTALDTGSGRKSVLHKSNIRRLTPYECARLQTIPDWYKWNCSETQQYKMLGNGWTIEVIKHMLKYLKP